MSSAQMRGPDGPSVVRGTACWFFQKGKTVWGVAWDVRDALAAARVYVTRVRKGYVCGRNGDNERNGICRRGFCFWI
jgi:hypothetical protein